MRARAQAFFSSSALGHRNSQLFGPWTPGRAPAVPRFLSSPAHTEDCATNFWASATLGSLSSTGSSGFPHYPRLRLLLTGFPSEPPVAPPLGHTPLVLSLLEPDTCLTKQDQEAARASADKAVFKFTEQTRALLSSLPALTMPGHTVAAPPSVPGVSLHQWPSSAAPSQVLCTCPDSARSVPA